MSTTTSSTATLPFQPSSMSPAQLAAVSFLARYSEATHALYRTQLARWFAWCETNGLDPLVGIQRAHVELYIRNLGDAGLDGLLGQHDDARVRGYFRFAHIDGTITADPADPAVYARLPKIHRDESRAQGLDRLELIRFLQIAQTITVHHGALAYLLGINALRASEAAAVRIEDYTDVLRGHRVLHLLGKGNKPATTPLTVPLLRVLEACRGERSNGRLVLRPLSGQPIDRRDVYRMVQRIAKTARIPRHISPHSLRHAAITNALDAGVPLRDAQPADSSSGASLPNSGNSLGCRSSRKRGTRHTGFRRASDHQGMMEPWTRSNSPWTKGGPPTRGASSTLARTC